MAQPKGCGYQVHGSRRLLACVEPSTGWALYADKGAD